MRILSTTLKTPGVEEPKGMTVYQFQAEVEINGGFHCLEREVGSQRSFYEPWKVDGGRIWLDAVDAVFGFMQETHAPCRLQANTKIPGGTPALSFRRSTTGFVLKHCCPGVRYSRRDSR